MRYFTGRRQLAVLVGLLVTLTMTSSACTSALKPVDEAEAVCDVNARVINPEAMNNAEPNRIHYQLYVELTDRSDSGVETVVSTLEPYVKCAFYQGSYLRVTVDPGEGAPLFNPVGLNGERSTTEQFDLDRQNDRGEKKARHQVADEVLISLRNELSAAAISETGSATRLLATMSRDLALSPEKDIDVVMLWSPLLGTSIEDTDCLDVTGVESSEAHARAMIRRCLDSGSIRTVEVDSIALVGLAHGATSDEQERFSGLLADQIYSQVFGL